MNRKQEVREFLESKGYKYMPHITQHLFFILPTIYLNIFVRDEDKNEIRTIFLHVTWLKWDKHFTIYNKQ